MPLSGTPAVLNEQNLQGLQISMYLSLFPQPFSFLPRFFQNTSYDFTLCVTPEPKVS